MEMGLSILSSVEGTITVLFVCFLLASPVYGMFQVPANLLAENFRTVAGVLRVLLFECSHAPNAIPLQRIITGLLVCFLLASLVFVMFEVPANLLAEYTRTVLTPSVLADPMRSCTEDRVFPSSPTQAV